MNGEEQVFRGLKERFPEYNEEEARDLARVFLDAVEKADPLRRKLEGVQISTRLRNVGFVSETLRKAREAMKPKMSQGDVARLMDCSISTINRIERGKIIPSKPVIQTLAEIYGISPEMTQKLINQRKG